MRSFRTIEIDVSTEEDPQKAILGAIASAKIEDTVVRLVYKIRSEQLELINTSSLYQVLKSAHSYTVRPELVSQLARPRLPELGIGNTLDPLEALQAYLDNKEDLQDISKDMLEAAESLLHQHQA